MIIGFTGPRIQKVPKGAEPRIKATLRELLLELKPKSAVSGMATGVDMWAAQACEELKIPFVAAVPFPGQEAGWNPEDQKEYRRLLTVAKLTTVSAVRFSHKAYQTRNEWIVDNCDLLLAFWDGKKKGGTYNCIEFAQLIGREIRLIEL